MGIFRKGEPIDANQVEQRYKIRITTDDGESMYWHKRGRLHIVDEDVAKAFVANFKPELFQVTAEGSFQPPTPGVTRRVTRVEMEPA